MANELILPGDAIPTVQLGSDADLAKLAGAGYLPYIQLVGSSSNLAKEGKAPVGRFILSRGKDKFDDLSQSFEALVVGRRARASRKAPKGFFSYFDQEQPEYKKIVNDSKAGGMTNCWHGTEYLSWLPAIQEWCTYHASNPTARTASKELNTIVVAWRDELEAAVLARKENREVPAVRNPQVKFSCAIVTYSDGNKQWGPSFGRATTPFSVLPPGDEVMKMLSEFCNPPKQKVGEAAPAGSGAEDMG